MQRGFFAFPAVLATHLPATLRPIAVWRKVSVTRAAWSRVTLKVVPTGMPDFLTGGLIVVTSCASLLPSSHLPAVCLSP